MLRAKALAFSALLTRTDRCEHSRFYIHFRKHALFERNGHNNSSLISGKTIQLWFLERFTVLNHNELYHLDLDDSPMVNDRWNAGTTHFISSFSKRRMATKLLTEMRDPFMKKASSGKCLPTENSPSLKSDPLKQEAASGKISNASVRDVATQLESCDLELKSLESSRRATSVGQTTGTHLPICPMRSSETITIRISNISPETANDMIHSICKSVGPLQGLMRKRANEVKVLFLLKNDPDPQSILKQLDGRIVDKFLWPACATIEGSSDAPMTIKGDSQCNLAAHISNSFSDLKKQIARELDIKNLYLQDLGRLHGSLVHLENHPNKMTNR